MRTHPRREPSPLLHFEMAILTTCSACQGVRKILFLRPRICMPPHRIACIIIYCTRRKISLPRCQTNFTGVVPHKLISHTNYAHARCQKVHFHGLCTPPFEDLATGLYTRHEKRCVPSSAPCIFKGECTIIWLFYSMTKPKGDDCKLLPLVA